MLQNKEISSSERTKVLNFLEALPLYFVKNLGQVNEKARYYSKTRHGMVYFTPGGIIYQFNRIEGEESISQRSLLGEKKKSSMKTKGEAVIMTFIGASKNIRIEGLEETEAKFSYFKGNDLKKWVSGASSYRKVIYRELYPGIDLIVYGDEERVQGKAWG